MAFCSFDESAALFDATPVENMFITEYMLRAPGDFVKVYLYGLMLCYHHSERMSLASMARDLDVTAEDVERAYRYWEREGLVRRTGDNPVCYTYYNLKQITLTRAVKPSEQLYNRQFVDEVRRTLDAQTLSDNDMQMIFDWIDVYELSEEAIIMLLQHEKEKSKTNRVSIKIAESIAKDWAQSGVRTVEDAEKRMILNGEREKELRRLLSRLGKRHEPSDDEKELYRKWRDEWGFSSEAIQEACKETTKGTPTMAYLDGILLRLHQSGRHDLESLKIGYQRERNEKGFAVQVFAALGRVGVTPSDEDKKRIDSWIQEGFSQEVIKLAADEVHERSMSGNLEDIQEKLRIWGENNCYTEKAVKDAREYANALNGELRQIYRMISSQKRVNQKDRDLLCKWKNEMSMSFEVILLAAEYSRSSGISMDIIDRILSEWYAAGITTRTAAEAYHRSHAQNANKYVATARTQDVMQRHQYTAEDYRGMVTDLDEEDS